MFQSFAAFILFAVAICAVRAIRPTDSSQEYEVSVGRA